jgi:hypothetical protein
MRSFLTPQKAGPRQRAPSPRTLRPLIRFSSCSNLLGGKPLRSASEVLLLGKLYDNRGNRMGPSHSAKNGSRYPPLPAAESSITRDCRSTTGPARYLPLECPLRVLPVSGSHRHAGGRRLSRAEFRVVSFRRVSRSPGRGGCSLRSPVYGEDDGKRPFLVRGVSSRRLLAVSSRAIGRRGGSWDARWTCARARLRDRRMARRR